MKKMLFFAAAMLISVTLVQADIADIYINDNPMSAPGVSEAALFELFNDYFDTDYESGNALIDAIGVKYPYTSWRTSGTQIVGGYGEANASHGLFLRNASDKTFIPNNMPPLPVSVDLVNNFNEIGNFVVFDNIPDNVDLDFGLQTVWGTTPHTLWSTPSGPGQDGNINMIALDITGLYNEQKNEGDDFDSVYMFAWEDLHYSQMGYNERDYQDVILIMTNIRPTAEITPEPATLAVLGLGLAGVGLASRRRRK